MSLYDADCLAGRSTGAAPSQKSHAGHNVLDYGVELSGDGFRLSEGGDVYSTIMSAMYSGADTNKCETWLSKLLSSKIVC